MTEPEKYPCYIMAIPEDLDFLIEIDGGPHITLFPLGMYEPGDPRILVIKNTIQEVAAEVPPFDVKTTGAMEWFGPNNNIPVMTLDTNVNSVLHQLRELILLEWPPDIYKEFKANEKFPVFRPHITLAFDNMLKEGEPDLPENLPMSVRVRALAVWTNEGRYIYPLMGDVPEAIEHYGTKRHSGRYPWGSGEDPQRSRDFLSFVDDLKKKGLSEKDIAVAAGLKTSTELRARVSISRNEKRKADQTQALQLKDKGVSVSEIGRKMGVNESTVRSLLNPAVQQRTLILETTRDMLKSCISEQGPIDIGEGAENWLGVSRERLNTAASLLKDQGYNVYYLKKSQISSQHETTFKVLAPPGMTYKDVAQMSDRIGSPARYSEDNGRSFLGVEPPTNISSSRISIRYAEQGGDAKDGVIELRPGVPDISLGESRYAQVRIAVDGTHYLKGMAIHSPDMPKGVDIIFNTNKSDSGNKLDAMKKLKDDEDNPFGATIRQRHYTDSKGNRLLSAINIVGSKDGSGEEGGWNKWSKSLASQVLSKQTTVLAKKQLEFAYDKKLEEFDRIMALTNPAVREKLLQTFANSCDSAAVHLKAAALPRQRSQVLLPIESMKDNEVYAPNFRHGETVVLIRYPHGGKFEIPELKVNNKNAEANRIFGGRHAEDAVGINPKVAKRLSGADFDGDTVLVIPNNTGAIKTRPALDGLKDFDPVREYPKYEGMKVISDKTKQREMGNVSNLINDMHIKGASESEIARAVRHSMVVIDAEKHELNYKLSYERNGIAQLKQKYQANSASGRGASTLISRASSEARVLARKPRSAQDGGAVDPVTGKKVFTDTGETYVNKKGKTVVKTVKSTKLAETDDAFSLSSGQPVEVVYAMHSNKLKALANKARKEELSVAPVRLSDSAKSVYSAEVKSLQAKYDLVQRNKPLERKALLIANATIKAKLSANPSIKEDPDQLKKLKTQAQLEARRRVGADKATIDITDREWAAIQAGAVSHSRLKNILDHTDLDKVKELATPRAKKSVSSATLARAKSMLASGYTQAEVADHLGLPLSTLHDAIA